MDKSLSINIYELFSNPPKKWCTEAGVARRAAGGKKPDVLSENDIATISEFYLNNYENDAETYMDCLYYCITLLNSGQDKQTSIYHIG